MRAGFVSNSGLDFVITVVVFAALLAVALLIREAARARVGRATGDTIPHLARRSTPGREALDSIGSGFYPLFAGFVGGMAFSWADPLNYDYGRPGSPRRVIPGAVAGSVANILLAVLVARFLSPITLSDLAGRLLGLFVQANVVMAVMHLVPIPPLDGARILSAFLGPGGRSRMVRIEPYGIGILFGLALLGRYFGNWPFADLVRAIRRLVA